MGVPTTTTAPQNVYYLIDDYATGGTGAGAAGTGNPVSAEFTASTLLDAQCMAQQFSQLFNRPVRLVQKSGAPPWTPLYSPTTCRVLPSPVPQSILF
jgi:hypothetical protein